jgi:outer membrane biosynthesis protein TonB
VIAFPDAKPFIVPPVDTLPVDLVPISEVTKLRIGEKTAELREVEATKPAEKPAEKPAPEKKQAEKTPTPTPPKPSPTPPAPTPPAPKEPTPPAPKEPAPKEPAPAPKEPAPKEPAPAPKEPEPAPKEAPPKEPVSEPKPEPVKEPAAPQPVKVTPRTKPTPPRPAPTQTAETPREFNPNDIAALLNKVEPTGGGSPNRNDTPASLGSRLGESGVTMSQSELDALRAQIQRCWSPPVGAAGASDLNVRLKISLTQSGEVDQRPEVLNSSGNPSFGIAAESARRAVLRCAPYSMPAAKYELWREVIINFDPRDLIGG